MKRIMVLILALMLPFGNVAKGEHSSLEFQGNNGGLFIYNEDLYVHSTDLMKVNENGFETIAESFITSGVNDVFSDGKQLYGIEPFTYQLLKMDIADGKLVKSDNTGSFIIEGEDSVTGFKNSFMHEGYFNHAITNYFDGTISINTYDINTGEHSVLNDKPYMSLAPYKGKNLLLSTKSELEDSQEVKLYLYDLKDKKLEEITSLKLPKNKSYKFFYSKNFDGIYFAGDGSIKKLLDDGKLEEVYILPPNYNGEKIVELKDGRLAFILQENLLSTNYLQTQKLYIADISKKIDEISSVTIRANLSSEEMNAVMKAASQVPIKLESSDNMLSISESLLMEDDSFDIIKLSSYQADLQRLAGKGYAAKITEPKLLQYKEELYDFLGEFSTYEGEVYAIPVSLSFNSFVVDKTAFSELDLKAPDNIAEYYKFWLESLNNPLPEGYVFSHNHLDIYEEYYNLMLGFSAEQRAKNKTIDFNDAGFKQALQNLLELYKAMPDYQEGFFERDESLVELISRNGVYSPIIFYNAFANSFDRDISQVNLPISGEEAVTAVNLEYFIINPNSKNIALAQTALARIIENLSLVQKLSLCRDYDEPIVSGTYLDTYNDIHMNTVMKEDELSDLISKGEENLSEGEKALKKRYEFDIQRDKYEVNDAMIAMYKNALSGKNLVVDYSVMAYAIENNIFARLISGSINIEQFAELMNNRVKLIDGERK